MRIFYIVILFILSGCTSSFGPGDKYLKKISQRIEKDYGITRGELIAKYDLVPKSKTQSLCLFAKDFGSIVGDESHSEDFLRRVNFRSSHLPYIPSYAKNKAESIYKRLYDINAKFKFISNRDLAKFRPIKSNNRSVFDVITSNINQSRENSLEELSRADAKIKTIPVFLPQTHNVITSNFGYRYHPLTREKTTHHGTDFLSSKHSPIYASADGIVSDTGHSKSYGIFILIGHQHGFKTRYAHLSKAYTKIGDRIFQGQLIGRQGKTGLATSDHLHFEILHQNVPIDPMIFVSNEYFCRRH